MGSDFNTSWYAISIYVMLLNLSFFSSFALSINNTNTIFTSTTSSLDDYLFNYSSRSMLKMPQTGLLYNITLPANFSNMEVAILRLRSSTLWAIGANFSFFGIPPKIITNPFVKRLAIMYENFGDLSSHYYDLPGYTLVTAVIGFAVYDATDMSGRTSPKRLNITTIGDPISVKFPQVQIPQERVDVTLAKCVRFDPASDMVELSDMVYSNVCSTRALGHFAIAMPRVSSPTESPAASPLSYKEERRKAKLRHRWVIGLVCGLVGLILVVLVVVFGYKMLVSRKFRRMETSAEKNEALDTRYIGSSKMPWASATRTQADIFENIDSDP